MVNVTDQVLGKNLRKSFSKTRTTLEIPNLIEIQKKSYEWFKTLGIEEVIEEAAEEDAEAFDEDMTAEPAGEAAEEEAEEEVFFEEENSDETGN